MGAASSKIEDKSLLLCHERRQFIRAALDGRSSLAAAHFEYIQSLQTVGSALRKFVEPDMPNHSSFHVASTSIARVPSDRFHVNHMKAFRSSMNTVEEKPPIPTTATVKSSTKIPRKSTFELDGDSSGDISRTAGWDYFADPVEIELEFQEEVRRSREMDKWYHVQQIREDGAVSKHKNEKDRIHEPEEEAGKLADDGVDENYFGESEDDFDKSPGKLVRIFKNRNVNVNQMSPNKSPALSWARYSPDIAPSEDRGIVLEIGTPEDGETPVVTPKHVLVSATASQRNGHSEEPLSEGNFSIGHLSICIREIEVLFYKASDAGKGIPKMLEANLHIPAVFSEERAENRAKEHTLFTSFLCCSDLPPLSPAPAPTPPPKLSYLTWHSKSLSSHSSSSRNPTGASTDDVDDLNGTAFSGIYLHSGSHASTLDRLFAWEQKLYDEVKSSGAIRREYDMKCVLLRDLESREAPKNRIDHIRSSVKDLYSRIHVAIHRINSISKVIEKLRDSELQPQLEELVGSLRRMWVMMLECHRNQHEIILRVSDGGVMKILIHSDSQRQATEFLEVELKTMSLNFARWMNSQKTYLQSLNLWLEKCVIPLKQKGTRKRNSKVSLREYCVPPIFATCADWLKLLDELPMKEVTDAIKELAAAVSRFLPPREKQGRGSKLMTLAKPRNQELRGETEATNGTPVDWSHNCEKLQSTLATFLDQLKKFAEESVKKYSNLQIEIDKARQDYHHSGD